MKWAFGYCWEKSQTTVPVVISDALGQIFMSQGLCLNTLLLTALSLGER
uniref:Transposase n=1 Tax=Heterorhabditis bacteriophora TaxID=37862 RepID=A0A1I7X5Q0_HETBA